jgi:hypothetical protein
MSTVITLSIDGKGVLRAAKVLVALSVFGALGVAHAEISEFDSGETLTATKLNGNFDDVDMRLVELQGAAVTTTEWVSYSANVTNTAGAALTSSPIGGGSTGYWRRVGDTLEVRIATTVNCTNGYPKWYLPTGLSIDTAKVPASYAVVGAANVGDGPDTETSMTVGIHDANGVVLLGSAPGSAVGTMDCNGLGTAGQARLAFSVPVAGWAVNEP